MKRLSTLILGSLSTLAVSACGGGGASYSLLAGSNTFDQSATTVNGKVDILFVIDNSGSMANNQTLLRNNFAAWIAAFDAKGLDYHIAITTTDAYRAPLGDTTMVGGVRKFKTSFVGGIMASTDADIVNEFKTNANVGTVGSGDERALQSFEAVLDDPANAGFPRADAALSIIMLGDEDDFAHNSLTVMQPSSTYPIYSAYPTGLTPISSFLTYLDTRLGVTPTTRTYNIHAITVTDQSCLNFYLNGGNYNGQHIGYRYIDMATQSGGTVNSMCNDFAGDLTNISNSIIELTTKFFLTRVPNASTLVVKVNGVTIPQDSSNGFTYGSGDNSISFHGSAVPSAGAAIQIAFDPMSL